MHSILIEIDMKRVSVEDSVYLKKYILVTVRPGGCEGTQFHGDISFEIQIQFNVQFSWLKLWSTFISKLYTAYWAAPLLT